MERLNREWREGIGLFYPTDLSAEVAKESWRSAVQPAGFLGHVAHCLLFYLICGDEEENPTAKGFGHSGPLPVLVRAALWPPVMEMGWTPREVTDHGSGACSGQRQNLLLASILCWSRRQTESESPTNHHNGNDRGG
ncbi:hypothetical protein SRHO_G00085100 [Serrasalmus rhombeus]